MTFIQKYVYILGVELDKFSPTEYSSVTKQPHQEKDYS